MLLIPEIDLMITHLKHGVSTMLPLEDALEKIKIEEIPVTLPGNHQYLLKKIIPEILKLIFLNLNSEALASCDLVCRKWHNFTNHDFLWNYVIDNEIYQLASFVFGKKEWFKYLGDIGVGLNYPRNICKILAQKCPFFEGQTVGKTHMFILVPEKVDNQLLTLHLLGKLVKKPKEGTKTGYDKSRIWGRDYENKAKDAVKTMHWILITKNFIPDSRFKTYAAQEQTVKKHAHYNIPNFLPAVLTFFVNRVAFGEFLFKPFYTRCQEISDEHHINVGCFGPKGLDITLSDYDYVIDYDPVSCLNQHLAVMACRRFDPISLDSL